MTLEMARPRSLARPATRALVVDRLRYAPLAAVAGFYATLFVTLGYRPGDVLIGLAAGRELLHGHLSVYADIPGAQMGPLSLLLAGALPRGVYVALTCALLAVFLLLVERAADWSPRRLMFAGVLLTAPWAFYAAEGHIDDALVLVAAAGILSSLREERHEAAAMFAVLGLAAKPTAVIALPLLLLASRRALLLAVAGGALVWAPFALADFHGFLAAGHGIAYVQPHSLPGLLGAPAYTGFPGWVRPVQLLVGLALTGLAARRIGAAQALLLAFVVRVALEPGAWPSYTSSLIGLALLVDSRRTIPAATACAAAAWAVGFSHPLDLSRGVLRLVLLAGVGVVAWQARAVRATAPGLPAATP